MSSSSSKTSQNSAILIQASNSSTSMVKSPTTSNPIPPQVPAHLKEEIIQSIVQNNMDNLKRLVHAEIVNIKDRSGNTLLHIATSHDKNEIAKWLLSQGAHLNTQCNSHTCLSIALQRSNFDLFNYYLDEMNADCSGRNQLNVLHEAANKNRSDLVEKLLAKQCDPNLYNSLHLTPIWYAIQNKNEEMIMLLLENGACVNLPDKKGSTALHHLFSTCEMNLIRSVVENAECDMKLKNNMDETCLDLLFINLMKQQNINKLDESLLKLLVEMGAQFSVPFCFEMSQKNSFTFLHFVSCLIKSKYNLKDLFIQSNDTTNGRAFLVDLILNCYWRNSLIIALKTLVYDLGSKTLTLKHEEFNELYKILQIIILSKEFDLKESDICSTFLYLLDNTSIAKEESKNAATSAASSSAWSASSASELDKDCMIVKYLHDALSSPFKLKDLCRVEIRRNSSYFDLDKKQNTKLPEQIKNFLRFESIQLEKS